jgi:PPOX class probable F420-dependent enzyme
MSRRDQIRMSGQELQRLLADERVVVCATHGRDGWPHLMPLWYVVRDGDIWSWTYAASQKVRNLERDARATIQVEAGEQYDELRGAMLRTRVEIERATGAVRDLGLEIYRRYAGAADGGLAPELVGMVEKQAPKRVALHFVVEGEPATWDHRKLGGAY